MKQFVEKLFEFAALLRGQCEDFVKAPKNGKVSDVEPILGRIFVDGQVWVVKYPEKLFELGGFNIMNDDRMGSIVPKGNISIGVHVRLGEEHLGFLYEEVFVHTEEGVVDKDIEISAMEVVVMVLSDG